MGNGGISKRTNNMCIHQIKQFGLFSQVQDQNYRFEMRIVCFLSVSLNGLFDPLYPSLLRSLLCFSTFILNNGNV